MHSLRIAIGCNGALGLGVLRALLSSRHQVVLFLKHEGKATPKQPGFVREALQLYTRFRRVGLTTPIRLARRQGIPVAGLSTMTEEELSRIRQFEPDLLLLAGFPIILKEAALSIPRIGTINVHPSLLPKFRGANPLTSTILDGATTSGVTFHVADTGVDTGDILLQVPCPLTPTETFISLEQKLAKLASSAIVAVVDTVERDGFRGAPQNHGEATSAPHVKPSWLVLDWNKIVDEWDRLYRALPPFMYPRFQYKNQVVRVPRVRFDHRPVAAPAGTVLRVWPRPTVALADGSVTLLLSFVTKPFPMPWPLPGLGSKKGEVLT